jgi:hypothetical protein
METPNPVPLQTNLSKAQTNKNNKAVINNTIAPPKKSSITKKVSLKYYRAQAVERASKVMNVLPQFIKFIKKLTPDQVAALKYYKGPGSFFQTDLLINHNATDENEKTPKIKTHELSFPFDKGEDESLQEDILGTKVSLQYPLWLPNMANIPSYINNSYGIRIKLLNILDTVFKHPECPKLTPNTIVFRGMSVVPDKKKIKAGETFEFKNFISTTYDRLVAERFSRAGYVFVLTGFTDVPCVYTPNLKGNSDNYEQMITVAHVSDDLSELTLPRGLEFKIDKVEQKHTSHGRDMFMWSNRASKSGGYKRLLTALKKQGLTPDDVNTTIEDTLYSKATFVYCSFVKWVQPVPIEFKKIKKTAKFVLDTGALSSWAESNNGNWSDDDN